MTPNLSSHENIQKISSRNVSSDAATASSHDSHPVRVFFTKPQPHDKQRIHRSPGPTPRWKLLPVAELPT